MVVSDQSIYVKSSKTTLDVLDKQTLNAKCRINTEVDSKCAFDDYQDKKLYVGCWGALMQVYSYQGGEYKQVSEVESKSDVRTIIKVENCVLLGQNEGYVSIFDCNKQQITGHQKLCEISHIYQIV